MEPALAWLEATSVAQALRSSTLAYPLVSATHIVGISLLVGTILLLDWQILAAPKAAGWRRSSAQIRPAAIVGLLLAAGSGSALFATRATEYAQNPALLVKLAVVAVALVNAGLFQVAGQFGRANAQPTLWMRSCACVSIILWLAAVCAGRWIAFVD